MTDSVQEHYGSDDIVAHILAAVPWVPETQGHLRAPQIYAFDQFHGRELLATRDHAARLAPAPGTHLLDIGAGIGGPARYFAENFDVRVTGIDITPQFVRAATDLTALCGLADRVSFIEADAAAMPFAAASFDHAYCFYVGMNLPDRPAVLVDCARVLRPGGKLIWTEVAERSGDPHFPLPWAATPATSHLQTRENLLAEFGAAGFDLLTVEDESGAHLELVQKLKQSAAPVSAEHQQANQVVLGPDFLRRRQNYVKSLAEGRFESLFIEARKPA